MLRMSRCFMVLLLLIPVTGCGEPEVHKAPAVRESKIVEGMALAEARRRLDAVGAEDISLAIATMPEQRPGEEVWLFTYILPDVTWLQMTASRKVSEPFYDEALRLGIPGVRAYPDKITESQAMRPVETVELRDHTAPKD